MHRLHTVFEEGFAPNMPWGLPNIANVAATACVEPCSLSCRGHLYQLSYSYTDAVRGRFMKLSSGNVVYVSQLAAVRGQTEG